MRRIALAAAVAALAATPAFAALKEGAKAPDFTAQGYQAGKPITFSMAQARKSGPVVLYFFPAAETAGCNLEARLFAESIDQFKAQGATVIGVTAGNLDKLASFSADTYDATLAVKPGWSNRTSYVISPSGEVIHAYSDLKANDHVTETLTAVKAWRAKHPK